MLSSSSLPFFSAPDVLTPPTCTVFRSLPDHAAGLDHPIWGKMHQSVARLSSLEPRSEWEAADPCKA